MATSSVSVVPVGAKKCKPFVLQVMVFSPEAGFKFEVQVEKDCSATNDPIWKLVFDLYKKQATGTDFDQIVHVSFTSGTTQEQQGVQSMVSQGVSSGQADALTNQVYPAAKALDGVQTPTPQQKQAVHQAMSNAATAVNVDV
ncbi:MAG TPA: hypothetical protein VFB76_14115 [Candidatus Angelobacter sp.]|nr:hypothetical protein [Candidatus Angelobacter sp.]